MKNIFSKLFLVFSFGMLFSSCIKDTVDDLTEGRGTSLLKVTQAPENKLFFSVFSDVKKVSLLTIRRDVNSNEELNKSMQIKVELRKDSITTYNTKNGTSYELLPDSLYTLGTGISKVGNVYTLTLAPGEIQKDLEISLNGAKWDLSRIYATYFKVIDSGSLKISSGYTSVISLLSIKNKWDGVYEVTGTMVDATSATLTHINNFLLASGSTVGLANAPMRYELRTISATKCEVYDNYFYGGHYVPITSGSTYSSYGSFSPIFEFDPATDKVIAVTNWYGQPASNTRSGRIDPTGVNAYNSSSKTLQIKYNMLQPSVVTAAPFVRTTWTETWKYTGSR